LYGNRLQLMRFLFVTCAQLLSCLSAGRKYGNNGFRNWYFYAVCAVFSGLRCGGTGEKMTHFYTAAACILFYTFLIPMYTMKFFL